MKRILISFFAGAMLAGVCMAQSAQSETSGSASQETSASATKTGAQAASNGSAAGAATQKAGIAHKAASILIERVLRISVPARLRADITWQMATR